MPSIEEENDLSVLPTDELLGKLLTHEIKMNQVVEEEMAKALLSRQVETLVIVTQVRIKMSML